jgi:hydroxyethylthiazole kinase-like uncharacterized protein yjeF
MSKVELLTPAEMAEADRLTIAGGARGIDLMERAGAAVADVAANLAPLPQAIAVICGPGNNGGDGFVAARVLAARGWEVRLYLLGDRAALRGDAALAAASWSGPVAALEALDFTGVGLVIDALFGAGLARDLDGLARATVERVNRWRSAEGGRVVAVDVPSGLDGATGQARGVAIEADASVTFFRFKPGHFLEPGRSLCGRLHLAQIGIGAGVLETIQPQTFLNEPALWQHLLPVPQRTGHKYSRGHVLVVSGGPWMTGAARLTARGALRTGAGLVTLASPREALTINAAHLTAVMLTPCDGPEELETILSDPRKNVVAIGPGAGVGQGTRRLVSAALRGASAARAVVLDADALTSFAGEPMELVRGLKRSRGPAVLTPHEGEFARLFSGEGFPLESNAESGARRKTPFHSKLTRARNAAKATGAVVLLKGPDTVVAAPDGRASILHNAPPWLATAGSGDVLAGIITGLLAQSMPPFEATSAAAYLHAAAAQRLGPGLIAEDLVEGPPLFPWGGAD